MGFINQLKTGEHHPVLYTTITIIQFIITVRFSIIPILHGYGHLSVISTYNPIYRMYNPIYNQL